MLASLLSILAAAACATLFLPPQYEARASVLLELLDADPVTGQAVNSAFADVYVRAQMEMVLDDEVTGATADALGWTSQLELMEQYALAEPDGQPDFRRWLGRFIAQSTRVTPLENSSILEITYTAGSPDVARLIANALRDSYIDEAVAIRRAEAQRAAEFLNKRALELAAALKDADRRKTAFEQRYGVTLVDVGTVGDARLAALSRANPPPGAAGRSRSPVNSNAQLSQLDAAIGIQSQTLGENHPAIQALRRQRAAMARFASNPGAPAASATGPSLATAIGQAQAAVLASAPAVTEARRLQAEVGQLRDRYLVTVARTGALRSQALAETAGLRPLESASTPTEQVFPNIPFIIGSAIVLGLVTGALVALITEELSRRVRALDDLAMGEVPIFVVRAVGEERKADRRRFARFLRWRSRRSPAPEPA